MPFSAPCASVTESITTMEAVALHKSKPTYGLSRRLHLDTPVGTRTAHRNKKLSVLLACSKQQSDHHRRGHPSIWRCRRDREMEQHAVARKIMGKTFTLSGSGFDHRDEGPAVRFESTT